MVLNEHGIGIYRVLIVVFLFGLCFILALPLFFNLDARKNAEQCVNNMREVRTAVEQYMRDREVIFTGTTADLVRTRYLRAAYEECPEGSPGNKYFISVDPDTREISIRCLMVERFPDHVLE